MIDNTVYVFMQDNMAVGGIESYVYKSMKMLKKQGAKIIWVKSYRAVIDKVFRAELFDGTVTIWNKLIPFRLKSYLKKNKSKRCKIITFDLFRFAEAEHTKLILSDYQIESFFFMPHFEGDSIFLENNISVKWLREHVWQKMADIFGKMNRNNNLYYFSDAHKIKATQNYNYVIQYKDVYVPNSEKALLFDENRIKKLYKRDVFNIISVSRFEFPHKGFLIGLIKEFAKIKPRYPNLKLTIVGYGEGERLVRDTINKYENSIKNSIVLVGRVAPDKLSKYYLNANLNISLAGCCTLGAKLGVLSLPARHYVYDCEVYGFMPDSANYRVSTEPGLPVAEYIERAIAMPFDEYYQKCKDSYLYFLNNQNAVTYQNIFNTTNTVSINSKDFVIIEMLKYYRRIKHLIIRIIGMIKKDGK